MRIDLAWARFRQRCRSAWFRVRGWPQPRASDIREARESCMMGHAGRVSGDPFADRCLARGYCCQAGCPSCPWGWNRATRRWERPAPLPPPEERS